MQEQTLDSLRNFLLEEVHEVIEAINQRETLNLEEEIGDVFFNLIFLCKVAQKEIGLNFEHVFQRIIDKLIQRNPHVFGQKKQLTRDEVAKQWEEIKATEKQNAIRKSKIDGIPKGLPALAKAQKLLERIEEEESFFSKEKRMSDEEIYGEKLWELTRQIHKRGLNAEQILRKYALQVEEEFKKKEKI